MRVNPIDYRVTWHFGKYVNECDDLFLVRAWRQMVWLNDRAASNARLYVYAVLIDRGWHPRVVSSGLMWVNYGNTPPKWLS